jgi:hypothetical protein
MPCPRCGTDEITNGCISLYHIELRSVPEQTDVEIYTEFIEQANKDLKAATSPYMLMVENESRSILSRQEPYRPQEFL